MTQWPYNHNTIIINIPAGQGTVATEIVPGLARRYSTGDEASSRGRSEMSIDSRQVVGMQDPKP